MDQLSPLGGLLKNKKEKSHGNTMEYRIRFHLVMGIPILKIESSNWDVFGDWMQLLIHDLACTE
jgi:hypothetical protein